MRSAPESPGWPTPHAEPPQPYQRSGRHLHLPAALPRAVAAAFASAADGRLEAGALLYGIRSSDSGHADVVHALVIPDQIRNRAHYRIPPEAIAAASEVTRARGLVTLAQIHSHPGGDVEHSWYDDWYAISTRAVSFVLPHYGRHACSWLDRAGVHDYQDGWWHQLTAEQVAERVSFTDTPLEILDLRIQNARTR